MITNTHFFGIINRPSWSHNGQSHHKTGLDRPPIKFCAIDGEGIERDGSHRYALLGCGSDQIINEDGLHWKTIFDFLYSHYEKGTAFVGFYLGYDFNQTFKTLPEERAAMLLTNGGREKRRRKGKNPAPFPVYHNGWEFDILGM